MNYFSKFEKFLPHGIIIPTFMTVGSQMPELDRDGGFLPPPYKIDSQNIPYKLGLITIKMQIALRPIQWCTIHGISIIPHSISWNKMTILKLI